MNFAAISLTYLFVMLAVFVSIGLRARKKVTSQAGFLLAGRSFGAVSNGVAGAATMMSEFLFIGMSGAVVATGFGYTGILYVFAIGAALGALVIAPYLRRAESYSIIHFLSTRYGRPAFWMLLTINFIFGAMFLLGQMKAAAITLQFLLPGTSYILALIMAGVFITAYTLIGGMYGVTYNQVVQGLLLAVACLLPIALILQAQHVAAWFNPLLGYASLSDILAQKGFYDLKQPAIYFASMVIPGLGLTVGPHVFVLASRAKTSSTLRYSIAFMLVFIAIIYSGAMAYAISTSYWIATTGAKVSPDYALFTMAQAYISPWIAALLVVGGFGAAISSVGSMLMFYGTAISHDLMDLVRTSTDREKLIMSYAATGLAAVFGILIAWHPPLLLATPIIWGWELLTVSIAPAVLMTIWWKRTHKWGVWIAIPVGAILTLMTQGWTGPVFKLPFYGSLITLPIAFLIITVVSLFAPKEGAEHTGWVDKLHGWKSSSETRYNGNVFSAVTLVASALILVWALSSV